MTNALSINQNIETSDQRQKLASARWADYADFAQRHRYKEGNFWLGRSPITGEMVGYDDDTHVLMCSGTRAGKGASIIINNLCAWKGSVVVIDPNGENANVTAARRGAGSTYCQGMKQSVHVLDPFKESKVHDSFRSRYNPLDAIDINGLRANDTAGHIAAAIIKKDEKGQNQGGDFWSISARNLLKCLILHVKTHPQFEGKRHLKTVRSLISGGDREAVALLKANGDEDNYCPHEILWERMIRNRAVNDVISNTGHNMQSAKLESAETYQGILLHCQAETEFLDSPAMQNITACSDFDLSELKTSQSGISIYLCLSLADNEMYSRWTRMMIELITRAMMKNQGLPKTGHHVLMCLDEFAYLDRMKTIELSVSQLAKYGLKMLFIVQGLEQLKAVYQDAWQTFMTNCGLKIVFGQYDNLDTMEYFSKVLGETEVSRMTKTHSTSNTTNQSHAKGITAQESDAKTHQTGKSVSDTITDSENFSHTDGTSQSTAKTDGTSAQYSQQWNKTKGVNQGWSEQQGKSTQQGTSKGKNFQTDMLGLTGAIDLASPFRHDDSFSTGTNSGTGRFKNSGRSGGISQSDSKGGSITEGENQSLTQTEGFNKADTYSKGTAQSHATAFQESDATTKTFSKGTSEQHTTGTSHTEQSGFNEVIHARPLIHVNEVKEFFAPRKKEYDPDHYPGYALVLTSNGLPTIIKRSNYFDDIYFTGWYDPHPDFAPPPAFQADVLISNMTGAEDLTVEWVFEPGQVVSKGDFVARVGPLPYYKDVAFIEEAHFTVNYEEVEIEPNESAYYWYLRAPHTGQLVAQFSHKTQDQRIGIIRTNRRQVAFDNCLVHLTDPITVFRHYQRAICDYVDRKTAQARAKAKAEEEARKRQEKRIAALRKREEEEEARKREEERKCQEEKKLKAAAAWEAREEARRKAKIEYIKSAVVIIPVGVFILISIIFGIIETVQTEGVLAGIKVLLGVGLTAAFLLFLLFLNYWTRPPE